MRSPQSLPFRGSGSALARRIGSLAVLGSLLLVPPSHAAPLAAISNTPQISSQAAGPKLIARTPLPKSRVQPVVPNFLQPEFSHERLVVKFADSWKARAQPDGSLVSLAGFSITNVVQIAGTAGLGFQPLIDLEPARVAALEQRAAALSGHEQPDLLGMVYLDGPDVQPGELVTLGNQMLQLPYVEFVYLASVGTAPPGDIAPATGDFTPNQQNYVSTEPGHGFEVEAVAPGHGLRLSVCEYGWIYSHEDLVDVDLNPEPGQTPEAFVSANDFDDHGTAAIGILASVANDYGATGVAGGIDYFTYPEFTVEAGPRRVECIAAAIADSQPGDIVLLEMQTSAGFVLNFVPAEFDPAVFTIVKVGTDAGVVIVGAAGNGNQDLDSPTFEDYRAMGDSGAILVGAGSSDSHHQKLPFSTFGSRIDVQSFGQDVFTLGYGDFALLGGDTDQSYTASFGGTSSASALVAGACAVLQSRALELFGQRLTPAQMRAALKQGARPQGIESGPPGAPNPIEPEQPIGPFPVLPEAVAALGDSPWMDLDLGLAGSFGIPSLSAQGTGKPGTPYALVLEGALPGAQMAQAIGLSTAGVGLLGGTLVPSPDFISFGHMADGKGNYLGTGEFKSTAVPGLEIFLQFWVLDPAGPEGWAATNGLAIQIQ